VSNELDELTSGRIRFAGERRKTLHPTPFLFIIFLRRNFANLPKFESLLLIHYLRAGWFANFLKKNYFFNFFYEM